MLKNSISLFSVYLFLIVPSAAAFAKTNAEEKSMALQKAKEIVAENIKPHYTDFEKVLVLHEYITSQIKYGKLNGKTSAYTALIYNQADCVGFARGLNMLFQAAGLDSFVVVRQKGHLWVKVKLHGNYYNIDPTWSALKSNWPQYSWFLLSDKQNVDTEKGKDHILDSGEEFAPATSQFTLKKGDYQHKQELYSSDKLRVMGTIVLPEDFQVPASGIIGAVNGSRFIIPHGSRSAFFIAPIKRSQKKDHFLKYTLKSPLSGSLVKTGYYKNGSTVIGKTNAGSFDVGSLDITGITFRIIKSKYYIQGEISLPDNLTAPKGGGYISMELTCYRGKERVRYYDWVYLPEGKKSASYHIDISKEDKDKSFYLYYYSASLERKGFKKVGYYGQGKTTPDSKTKKYIELKNGLVENVNLEILR